tara:strand:- start:2430 stop:2669 length:240 start_codon:yes stop_codon:yes gene_type:complete
MSEEMTIKLLAEKIAKDFYKTVKEKTDDLLQLDAIQYTNLGIDSKKYEKAQVKSDSKFIYKQLKTIDKDLGEQLLTAMD